MSELKATERLGKAVGPEILLTTVRTNHEHLRSVWTGHIALDGVDSGPIIIADPTLA